MNSATALEPTVGLEVHVQLATRSKLFCACAWRFGEPPNTLVCPVCLGHPGVLPVLNSEALLQGTRASLALGMEVNTESRFDRKNYFYPDLPKGYQITQFDRPLGSHGCITLESGYPVRILRLHLEEDAGKTVHDRGDFGLVDFNRAGAPLAEIVSEPDMRSTEEVREYLETLKQILRYAGVSDCDMEKGNLRVDVNVSLAPPGRRATGVRTEIKNLNSFANVGLALKAEIERQTALLAKGGTVRLETRLWDEESGTTRVMRSKEEANDYRYFPEPDLPLLVLDADWIEEQRRALPESAVSRRARYTADLGLSDYDARVLTAERDTADFFEGLLAAGVDAKQAANWTANEVARLLPAGAELAGSGLDAPFLAAALALLHEHRTNRNGVKAMLAARVEGDARAPEELLGALGLEVQADAAGLEDVCRKAIEALPAAAEDVRNGKEKALGALLGCVMKATSGSADPATAREVLLRLIGN